MRERYVAPSWCRLHREVPVMSHTALEALIQRAQADPEFRKLLQFDPRSAFAGVDLTPEEFNALKSGKAANLKALGLDDVLATQGARIRLSPTLRWPIQ
jgi:hypothetical protein